MQAVIMAGGKGTRLAAITKNLIPKPMAPICSRPILEWQIETLKNNGVTDIVLVIGYLGEKIEEYFQDGSNVGVRISYVREEQPLGTAGAFYYLKEFIKDDNFLLVFGDVLFDISVDKMFKFHTGKNALATLFVHPNGHPYDSDLVIADSNQKVIRFDSKNNTRDYWYDNCVNAGIYCFHKNIFNYVMTPEKLDLEKDVLSTLVAQQAEVYAYASPEYVKDVGTVERIEKAAEELASGYVANRNLNRKQRAIFLDRDGTINKKNGLVYKSEQFELEACAVDAIRKINQAGYLAIVITNQPVVARGLCSIDEVEEIHNKMKTLLGQEGVYLDAIKYCPHHPDKGYPEENLVYKIPCHCRKPEIGLIEECVSQYNIGLEKSWFVGDTTVDIQTGQNAGMKTILVQTGDAGKDQKYDVVADFICKDLLDAVETILKG